MRLRRSDRTALSYKSTIGIGSAFEDVWREAFRGGISGACMFVSAGAAFALEMADVKGYPCNAPGPMTLTAWLLLAAIFRGLERQKGTLADRPR